MASRTEINNREEKMAKALCKWITQKEQYNYLRYIPYCKKILSDTSQTLECARNIFDAVRPDKDQTVLKFFEYVYNESEDTFIKNREEIYLSNKIVVTILETYLRSINIKGNKIYNLIDNFFSNINFLDDRNKDALKKVLKNVKDDRNDNAHEEDDTLEQLQYSCRQQIIGLFIIASLYRKEGGKSSMARKLRIWYDNNKVVFDLAGHKFVEEWFTDPFALVDKIIKISNVGKVGDVSAFLEKAVNLLDWRGEVSPDSAIELPMDFKSFWERYIYNANMMIFGNEYPTKKLRTWEENYDFLGKLAFCFNSKDDVLKIISEGYLEGCKLNSTGSISHEVAEYLNFYFYRNLFMFAALEIAIKKSAKGLVIYSDKDIKFKPYPNAQAIDIKKDEPYPYIYKYFNREQVITAFNGDYSPVEEEIKMTKDRWTVIVFDFSHKNDGKIVKVKNVVFPGLFDPKSEVEQESSPEEQNRKQYQNRGNNRDNNRRSAAKPLTSNTKDFLPPKDETKEQGIIKLEEIKWEKESETVHNSISQATQIRHDAVEPTKTNKSANETAAQSNHTNKSESVVFSKTSSTTPTIDKRKDSENVNNSSEAPLPKLKEEPKTVSLEGHSTINDEDIKLIPTKKNSSYEWGFKDQTGKIVIPCEWHKAWSFSEGLALVEDVNGKRGFINKTGEIVIPCERFLARKWSSEGLNLGVDVYKGKYGFADQTGKIVIPCEWHKAWSFSGGLAHVEDNNGKHGFIDKTGKIIIPCEWKYAWSFSEGLALVKDDNYKWGFIDKTGKVIIPCNWKYALSFSEGLARVEDNNGKWGFIDKTGNIVIPCEWKGASSFYEGLGLACVKDNNGKWGGIDKTGKIVIPCEWKFSKFSVEYRYDHLEVTDDNGKTFAYDTKGNLVEESIEKSIKEMLNGRMPLTEKSTKTNSTTPIIDTRKDSENVKNSSEAPLPKPKEEQKTISQEGHSTINNEDIKLIPTIGYSGSNFKWGFEDLTGEIVIPCEWKHARSFSEGLAPVEDDNEKYGYIDKTGKIVIPCEWKYAASFSDGLALVEDNNGKYGYIDKTGKIVIPCVWKDAGYFSDGLALVKVDNEKYGYIDKTGKVVITCEWRMAWSFSDGLALVEDNNGKYGYIDKTGKTVIPCEWCYASCFDEGLAEVKGNNGKYGFIDKNGKIVIPCEWYYTGGFHEGLASVKGNNGKYGFIDKNGKIVIPCEWKFADRFYHGTTWVFGKYGTRYRIDKKGTIIEKSTILKRIIKIWLNS